MLLIVSGFFEDAAGPITRMCPETKNICSNFLDTNASKCFGVIWGGLNLPLLVLCADVGDFQAGVSVVFFFEFGMG